MEGRMDGSNSPHSLAVEWDSPMAEAEGRRRPRRRLSVSGARWLSWAEDSLGQLDSSTGLVVFVWGDKGHLGRELGRCPGLRLDEEQVIWTHGAGWHLSKREWREKGAQHGAQPCMTSTPTPWPLSTAQGPWGLTVPCLWSPCHLLADSAE